MRDWHRFNADVIDEFRATGGRVERFGDLPVVILHTVGARTGLIRPIPLIAVFDGDEMFVFGTAAGSRTDPAWCANLRSTPRITVETADGEHLADVVELDATAAQRMIDARVPTTPQLADYVAAAAPRRIPVFSVTPLA